jgi:hemerythrin superfamily protein
MFDIIQRQHAEILKLAQDMLKYDSIPQVSENAFNISLLLGNLSGKLTFHLSGEDKCIYPYLMNKQDKTTQETTRQFASEMGGLAQAFNDYITKYLSGIKIKDNPAGFIQESREIMKAVIERIDKEEKFLYPLL